MAITNLMPVINNVTVLYTNKCNINCAHCYVSSSRLGEWGLSPEVVYKVIDTTANLANFPLFTLSGGEPLVRRDDCLAILDYAQRKVNTQLLTNGILITRDVATRLAAMNISIRISLDGVTSEQNDSVRGPDAFKNTLQGISNLISAGFPRQKLSLCATILDIQPELVNEYLNLCEGLGLNAIRFHALCRMGRGIELARSMYGEENSNQLVAHKKPFTEVFENLEVKGWKFNSVDNENLIFHEINIHSNGEVYPYVVFDYLNPRPHELSIGNIGPSSFEEILKSPKMSESILLKFLALTRNTKTYSRAFTASRDN